MPERIELTEVERFDFNRRTDIALSVVPSTSRLLCLRAKLQESIEKLDRRLLGSLWLLGVGILGLLINYFQYGTELKAGAGTWILVPVGLIYLLASLSRYQADKELKECQVRIEDREMTWMSAGGDVHNLRALSEITVSDDQVHWSDDQVYWFFANEALETWWENQLKDFYVGACGSEKGWAMAKQRKEDWMRLKQSFESDLDDLEKDFEDQSSALDALLKDFEDDSDLSNR